VAWAAPCARWSGRKPKVGPAEDMQDAVAVLNHVAAGAAELIERRYDDAVERVITAQFGDVIADVERRFFVHGVQASSPSPLVSSAKRLKSGLIRS
jgi:hypothetical protein